MHDRLRLLALLLAPALLGVVLGCEEAPPPPPEGPRPVKVYEIGHDGAGQTREYPGRIKAGQYSEMGFEVPGRVVEFVFKEGAQVERNAVLARLDPRDYQSRFDSSNAKLAHARSERDRYKEMYEKDVKPYSEYELRLRSFDVAKAELEEAKKALDDTVLRAPFEGVMARKLVEEFENVLAKQPVLVLQNDDLLEIKVSVPERDLARNDPRNLDADVLTRRLRPQVVLSSLPDDEFSATLKEIATVADPATRTFEATFVFEKPPGTNILGGMTAKVVISVPDPVSGGSLSIPAVALVPGPDRTSAVWIVDPDSFEVSSRPVVLGSLQGDRALIQQGLEPGELVATSGLHQLQEGMVVTRFDDTSGPGR